MQCPYCGQQHLEGTQFCPVTGNRLTIQQTTRRGFYVGLGLFSTALVTVSLLMLLLNRNGVSLKSTTQAIDIFIENSTSQTQPSMNDLQSRPTVEPTATLPPTSMPTETPVPIPSPVELKVNSADRAEIVLVPAGEFLMGSDQANDPYFWGAEAPQHSVSVDTFWIYRTEVTQHMYQVCDAQDSCPAPVVINDPIAKQYGNPRFDDYPVVMITWQAAAAYCKWAGGRLPTEAEWEKAARGTDGRLFPWGSETDVDGLANFASASPVAVGSYPIGSSPYGVYDMAGNVLEWVNDFFESGYYQYSPLDNPLGPLSGGRKVIRGGAFNHSTVDGLRTVARASLRPTDTKVSVGFRCVIDSP
jgi:formylglycine-generating enzyme required for sulfatase activity